MNKTNAPMNRAERRAQHRAQVTETRRILREKARKNRLAKIYS